MRRLTSEELTEIRERAEKVTAWPLPPWREKELSQQAREDIPKLVAEIERLSAAISWSVSCVGCSNQLTEDWEIVRDSFVCRECIEYGGDSE